MKSERWDQIQNAFHAAVEIEPRDRRAYLARMYPDDPELWQEVESLLRAHEDSSHFLEQRTIDDPKSVGSDVRTRRVPPSGSAPGSINTRSCPSLVRAAWAKSTSRSIHVSIAGLH